MSGSPYLIPEDDSGYFVDEADVTYRGICPACQATTYHPARETA
jgi:Fe2+ or Zn2+ uptake regulation protein